MSSVACVICLRGILGFEALEILTGDSVDEALGVDPGRDKGLKQNLSIETQKNTNHRICLSYGPLQLHTTFPCFYRGLGPVARGSADLVLYELKSME